jgi:tetratricopeptide (TPR) repeat protein
VSKRPRFSLTIVSSVAVCTLLAAAENSPGPRLEQEFQSAVAYYRTGQFPEAAAQLENLLPQVPKSFEVHELLGLVYAAQSQNAKAVEQLQLAANLKPESAAAHTNLAAALVHARNPDLAGQQFRKALDLEPHAYDANHNLGEFYIQTGKIAEAISFLEEAQRITPTAYDNSYDLAQAYLQTGRLAQASQLVQHLLEQKDAGELHNLLGQIDEKDGKFIEAANQFEIAGHMDPSEDNLFEWGSELLIHRTYEPAIQVFETASQRYPNSPRLKIGLGLAYYLRGRYDDAVKALLAAADLNPADPRCYVFLSKAYDSSPNQADEVIRRFRRFSELQPRNARAQYYYAMSLWKGKRAEDPGFDLKQIESLLQKSIALDQALPEAHVQLANLYAGQHEYAKSIPEYERALQLNPNLPDAHYRLAQDYVHTGQKERAQSEFDLYQRQRAAHMAELDKQKDEIQQFVYSAKGEPSTKP